MHADDETPVAATTGELPTYDELLRRTDVPPGAAWGLWGADDELGTVNLLTPERVVRAAAMVRTGRRFNLDHPINAFEPYPSGTRHPARHHVFANNDYHRDDWLDSFYMQSSSQIDSLRHIGHPEYGFYGGRAKEEIGDDGETLGVHRYGQAGIVGRGVLLDVDRHLAARGRPLGVNDPTGIDADLLDAVADAQGVTVENGDVLLIRTGWAARYLALGTEERMSLNKDRSTPGLAQTEAVVRWLWDHRIAMVAADNTGVERFPAQNSDFYHPDLPPPARGPDHNGMIHRPLIALLGMAMGELWALEELADDCAEDGRYEFLLMAKPLNLIGGAGSPCNALAVK